MSDNPKPPFSIWQGFRHSWTYNHRLNRIGDWLRVTSRNENTLEIEVGHSAASGTGRDEASFRSFHSITRAGDVHYEEFKRTITITSQEQETQTFVRQIRIGPGAGNNELHDEFVAVLSGFDLYSGKDADKLASFHLAASAPRRLPETGEIVFSIIGALNVDCDSPECDNHSTTGELIGSVAAGAVAGINLIGSLVGGILGGLFGGLFAKLDINTDYTLDLYFALLTGHSKSFRATRHTRTHSFDWDTNTPIMRKNKGTICAKLEGDSDPRWRVCIPAITQISLEVTRERGFLRPDTAMHLLEWDMAILPIHTTGNHCTANLELFFRNWRERESQYLDDFIESPVFDEAIEDVFSHRDAGCATATMGIALLQFAWADTVKEASCPGNVIWDGRGMPASSEDAVRTEQKTYSIREPTLPISESDSYQAIWLSPILQIMMYSNT